MSETQLAENKPQTLARQSSYLRPHYEVAQDKEAYTVRVFVPGASKETVRIEVDQDTLSIEAGRKTVGEDNWRPRYREIPTADYRLRLDLNAPVDAENISAKTENGVLSITLPVAEAAKPRQITVN